MPKPIKDQVVVVTGASSGIGRTTVRMLAGEGASVVATARSAEDLTTLVDETARLAGTVVHVIADVADEAGVRSVASAAVERFGRIDTWVGTAAVSVYGRAWDIPTHEYDLVMRTNWLGQVYGALAALPELRRSGGTLVCIGSVESVRAVPLHAPYTASKMALRGFCDSLRLDLDADKAGVAVSLVMPGPIDTPFFEHSRSYTEGAPKPPSPVYSPESVAKSILQMAQHPQREVLVGGAAFGFVAGQKLAPRLTDRLMTARHSMHRAQQSDGPERPGDTLNSPMPGTGTERGGHSGRRSLSAAVTTARPLVRRAAAVGAAAAGVAASRLMRHRGDAESRTGVKDTSVAEDPAVTETSTVAETVTAAQDAAGTRDVIVLEGERQQTDAP